jgi:hypothetical protein
MLPFRQVACAVAAPDWAFARHSFRVVVTVARMAFYDVSVFAWRVTLLVSTSYHFDYVHILFSVLSLTSRRSQPPLVSFAFLQDKISGLRQRLVPFLFPGLNRGNGTFQKGRRLLLGVAIFLTPPL